MTDLSKLIEHAQVTDAERGILRALCVASVHGVAQAIADRLMMERRTFFRALKTLEAAGIVTRTGTRGRNGEVHVTFSDDALALLRRRCHYLGRDSERPGMEYHPVPKGTEDAVRADRARLMASRSMWRVRVTRDVALGAKED